MREVVAVDHLACVNAYYSSMRVSLQSLRAPIEPYARASTSKKRKRSKAASSHNPEPPPPALLAHLEEARLLVLDAVVAQATPLALPVLERIDPMPQLLAASDGLAANDTDDDGLVMQEGHQFLLPRRSTYFLGDVRSVQAVDLPRPFRLIVIDPPWDNKSVARNGTYATMHEAHLLPLAPLLSESMDPAGCIVAIWVTNKPAYMTFLLDALLPAMGIDSSCPRAMWTWLKVATTGEPVTPLASTHRLPFERLVVAARGPAAFCDAFRALPEQTLVSVPLRHSWKPPIDHLFPSTLLPSAASKLELFARELRPYWTSVGNEVLKFQDLRLFTLAADDDDKGALRDASLALDDSEDT
ncbi:hypothetical protein SPRG_19239 [Saprolegnia parasitica CBS 223.65]|uniref:Methyltransferase-like protein 4 n=1 Tax=Saprolegnia parasitica (strain CBS 223.65) TaxID=695850 RepID=A0A067D4G6_SAPPC|nr:hypothetical protein SPRG_19239 [Saprolegnia parasitica CBS 223.65]KDO33611.1 hypothetical protein SPRG_19239 [Saprolegnia parasitica CBS 223.65]|eukprot:XP_012195658.1 hypothetical protein SPRG_19239 [Saprolegnia parasitica CBS 223.65]